jgi:hypothetical protein
MRTKASASWDMMEEKRLGSIDDEEYHAKHRHDSERISRRCRVGAPAVTIAFVLPKLEPVAESLDELTHET